MGVRLEHVDLAAGADELQAELRDLLCLAVGGDHVRSLARDISLNWVPDGWLGVEDAQRLVGGRPRSGLAQMGSSPDGPAARGPRG